MIRFFVSTIGGIVWRVGDVGRVSRMLVPGTSMIVVSGVNDFNCFESRGGGLDLGDTCGYEPRSVFIFVMVS